MSQPTTLSAIVVTYKRPEELGGALACLFEQQRMPEEIIVLDDDPAGSGRQAPHLDHPLVHYHYPGVNSGPAGARNRAAREAHGDILLFLDDDCRFAESNATALIMDAFTDGQTHFVTFLVRNATTGEIVPREYPGYSTASWNTPHEVSYFIACGFAIRREVFEALGGFDEILFHGEEELEFSLRLINAGYRLHYMPAVLIRHHTSPRGRDSHQLPYRLIRNRIYLAVKHLPLPFLLSHLVLWSGFALLKAIRQGTLREFARGVRSLRQDGLIAQARAYRNAHPMHWETVKYLWTHEGRLIY